MLNFHPDIYQFLCHHWQEDIQRARLLQQFATVASLIELQMYPTNAKYHMQLDGVPIGCETRSKDVCAFDALKKDEVQQLYDFWKGLHLPD